MENLNKITEQIIKAAYTVSNTLGAGFLEKVYENAICIELQQLNLKSEKQKPLQVLYKQAVVGEYCADIFVEDEVIVELKAIQSLNESHQAQLMNYLRACNKRVGLLINFGNTKVEIKRIINGY